MIIQNRKVILAPGQQLFLVPWGDVQSESEYPRLIKLVKWLRDRQAEGHGVLMFGMGDYFEAPAPSDQAALRASKRGFGMYDDLQKAIDEVYGERADAMVDILRPLQSSILGLLRGHHQHNFSGLHEKYSQRIDTDEYLANRLNAKNYCVLIAIDLSVNGLPFRIFASHGYGSARTPGARVTKRVRMRDVYGQANWYVMGHDDEKMVYVLEAIQPDGNYLKQYFTGSGSFFRGFEIGNRHGSFVESLLLPPAAMGVVMCILRHEEHDGQARLDYHIST